ncbi:unnamed protein product [Protopolystoma xenopodis]|uniref:histone acetyltransferase n=1 Tax=Protopolystoma xenopodis TaxID=117903 RepID=A0A448XHZ8_9PLAT|nr:unnamed protein product [Protopolystoma xenopodis]
MGLQSLPQPLETTIFVPPKNNPLLFGRPSEFKDSKLAQSNRKIDSDGKKYSEDSLCGLARSSSPTSSSSTTSSSNSAIQTHVYPHNKAFICQKEIAHSHDPSTLEFDSPETRNPRQIQLGKYVVTTWYSAPYPSEYARLQRLYICEYCLKYIKSRKVYLRHMRNMTHYRYPAAARLFPPVVDLILVRHAELFDQD